MKSAFVATLALASACTEGVPSEPRELAEMPQLSAVVDVDITPDSPSPGLRAFMDYPGDVCYTLDDARALVDNAEPEQFEPGGPR